MNAGKEIDVIDDDEVSRELISLYVEQAGYTPRAVDSGEAEILHLRESGPRPCAILADLQMPGLSGNALASALREVSPGSILVAMSATRVTVADTGEYDAFLQKPFDGTGLAQCLEQIANRAASASPQSVPDENLINQKTFQALSQSMPAPALREFYDLCLSDAVRRVTKMREAVAQGDHGEFHRCAHAIKGSCAMVGAQDLASRASAFEEQPSFTGGEMGALDEFLNAVERLRRILDRNSPQAPGDGTP